MAVVFATCELLHYRTAISVETTRKLSHVCGGIVVFFMPWTIGSHWTVLAIAATFSTTLIVAKRFNLLRSVHAVKRRTRGAEYYPLAIYLTFVMADGNPLLFQIPVLVLAFSDTGAAVVGKRYGVVHYRVIEGVRSLGGSVTFFGVTFALVLLGLGCYGHGDLPTLLLISLLTAMIATAVEGISVRGADNLLIPYATFLVLRNTINLSREGLGEWVLGTALVLAVLLATYKQVRLNATGFMAVFLSGALAWGLAGPAWLATLAVPYLGYSAVRPTTGSIREADLTVVVPALSVSMLFVLLYGHTAESLLFVPFLASVATVSAIALSNFCYSRWQKGHLGVLAALVGAAATLVPTLFMSTPVVLSPVVLALIYGGAMLGPVLVHEFRGTSVSPLIARFASVMGGTTAAITWLVGQTLG